MPSLFRFLVVLSVIGGLAYAAGVFACQFRSVQAARDHRHRAVRQIRQVATLTATTPMGRRPKHRDAEGQQKCRRRADRPVPRHAGGRARCKPQHAEAYGRDLAELDRALGRPAAAASPKPRPTTCAAISARSPSAASRPRQSRGICRRCGSCYRFLYAEGKLKRRSGGGARRAQARPRAAESICRSPKLTPCSTRHAVPAKTKRWRPPRGCAPRGSIV